uniref:tripartite tricarboxylate transporter TctB family protein n=1 Tax=Pararhizobium sp. IMCC3301 TaxID=3067904 RepID=UPI00274285CA|nr:tripartite tricarboxylate transporter TctB family protein [Pararhizobium sp. IMCC3301]
MSSLKPPITQAVYSNSDFWTGAVIFVTGFIAAWMASGFDDLSRPYPLSLGIILAILGLLLSIKAVIGTSDRVSFILSLQSAVPSVIIIVSWITAISTGLGYLIPTFLMQAAFMILCGMRDAKKITLFAALVSTVSYTVFMVLLGVRIPTPVASWIL